MLQASHPMHREPSPAPHQTKPLVTHEGSLPMPRVPPHVQVQNWPRACKKMSWSPPQLMSRDSQCFPGRGSRGSAQSPQSSLAIVHSPSGVSHSPSGGAHSPSGIAHSPSGVSHSPSGGAHSPSGIAHSPSGVSHSPSGFIHLSSGLRLLEGRTEPLQGPSRFGRHALEWVTGLVVTEDERKRSSERPDLDLDTKVVVFLCNLLGVCCGFGYAAVWAHLRCYYTAVFPGFLGLLCTIGAVHLRCTRSATLAAPFLGYGTALAGLGTYWSMGGNMASLALVVWAFAGIQMAIITTRRITPAFAAHLVTLVLMVLLTILESVLGAGSFSPQECHILPEWQTWLHLSNTALPCTIPTVCLVFIIQQMRKEARYLEESQAKAVAVAQKIADFDLEGLPDASPDATMHLLLQIAGNLRQYQPYLPGHLLAARRDSQETRVVAMDHGKADAVVPVATTPPSPHAKKAGSSAAVAGAAAVSNSNASPRHLSVRPRGLDMPFNSCTGTLLYVRLPGLQLLTQSAGAEALAKLQTISDVLTEAVVRFVTQTRGVVQTLRHDGCLASWNLLQKCSCHVGNALTAAVSIRDYFNEHAKDHSVVTELSMGVWSGFLVCGPVGTSELKSFSCMGPGVEKVSSFGRLLSARPSDVVCSGSLVGTSLLRSPAVVMALAERWRWQGSP